jgi:hypothetical protein
MSIDLREWYEEKYIGSYIGLERDNRTIAFRVSDVSGHDDEARLYDEYLDIGVDIEDLSIKWVLPEFGRYLQIRNHAVFPRYRTERTYRLGVTNENLEVFSISGNNNLRAVVNHSFLAPEYVPVQQAIQKIIDSPHRETSYVLSDELAIGGYNGTIYLYHEGSEIGNISKDLKIVLSPRHLNKFDLVSQFGEVIGYE